MRVTFDALVMGTRPSGVLTRLLNLAPRLVRRGFSVRVLCQPGLNELLPSGHGLELETPNALLRGRGHAARWIRRRVGMCRPREAEEVFIAECLPWPAGSHVVGVLHDLRRLNGQGSGARLARRVIRSSLAAVGSVHVVSDATRERLSREYPSLRRPAHVVPNGVELERFQPGHRPADSTVLDARGLRSGGYLLCVGHLEARKAPDLTLAVRTSMARRSVDLPVVFVGKGEYLPEERLSELRAEFPGQAPGMVLRDVGDEELPALYRNTACVVAPAREEGFGMAPLEALACGAPVVASDIPAHREVLGDAAVFARRDDVTRFTNLVLDVVEGRATTDFARLGPRQASGWSWDSAADTLAGSLRDHTPRIRR